MSTDQELKEIKTLISSLLVSNPNKSTIQSLDREFRQEIGCSIPFRKFGYASVDSFLRSMPDVLNVLGSGYHATLQVLVSNKVAHIDNLISKQKSSGKKRTSRVQSSRFYDNCTRSAPRPAYEPPRAAYQPPRAAYESPRPAYLFPLPTCQPLKLVYESPKSTPGAPQPPMKVHPGFPNSTPVQNSSPFILTHTPPSSTGTDRFSESDYGSPKISTTQGTPKISTTQGTPLALKRNSIPEKYVGGCVLKIDHSEGSRSIKSSQNLTSTLNNLKLTANGGLSSAQTSNFKVPYHVQDNLLKLVRNHPNGLDCSMVPSLYRNMYKDELNYCKFGYRNLIQMIKDFPETYHCFRPDCGDYKIFDKSLPLPTNLDSCNASEVKQNGTFGGNNKSAIFPDSALPENMYLPIGIEYPPDVVKLKEIIPRQFVSESTREFDEIELHVGEVYDPSKFWIIMKEDFNDLEELMSEMQVHYSGEYDKLKIDEQYLESGMFCVAVYGTQFHRALLTKVILSDHKANIFYFDYGTVATVDSRNLYFLTNKFAYLPQQAIRARLAGIIPPVAQSPWSVETTLKFLSLVQYRSLIGKICRIDREQQVLDVVLIDASRSKRYVINDALVKAKLAICSDQVPKRRQFSLYVPSVDSIYHYPTFDELENFLVPSLPELMAKTELNILHDEIYPAYYRLQVNYPEDSESSQSISDPVRRRQHLKEIYPNSNNEIGTTENPAVMHRVIKPPPGFSSLPMLSLDEKLSENMNGEFNQFIDSSKDNTGLGSVSSDVHKLCNDTVSPPSILIHENTHNSTKNLDITTINRQEFTHAMSSMLKEGNIVIVYSLDRLLKEFLVATEISRNLMKYLKTKYVTLNLDILEEMMSDVLDHFDDLQLSKVCDSIRKSVPEFQFPLPSIEQINSSSSESCFPSSKTSRSPSPKIDALSPYAPAFVPSKACISTYSHPQLSPILKPELTDSQISNTVEPKSSNSCYQDNTTLKTSNEFNCDPVVPETPYKCSTPTYEEPNPSNFYNYDTTDFNASSKPCLTQPDNKFIFKKKLHGNVVHLINLNEQIYITISEIQQVTKLKDTNVKTIQKNIAMYDGAQYLHDVNLNEHADLKEELQSSNLEYDDEILRLMRIEFIPEFFKLFRNIMFPQSSFKRFLQEVYESDDTTGYL